MEKFVVIESSDTDAILKFSNPKNDYFEVSFDSNSLRASKKVWGYSDCDFLVGLFDVLASKVKGWDGSEEWISLEGDFKIALISDNLGHVTIKIELSNCCDSESWEIYAELIPNPFNKECYRLLEVPQNWGI